ncbi:MAG: hypothetical protein K2R98_28500 [Gemmataceae bacterium]|nr:hypothetical protein [Gemmataceae bacterium]
MLRLVTSDDSWEPPKYVIEEVNDPEYVARFKASMAQFKANLDWLQAHWGDLLPQARGKYVAVAGREAFIADTAKEAYDWADTAHPYDEGAWVTHVRRTPGYNAYANRVSAPVSFAAES